MYILGISAYYHDAAATLVKNGHIVAAAQEERFSRIKHDPSFPTRAVRFCLEYEGIRLKDVESVVFYDKPFLKFERLLETYYTFAPRGIRSFLASAPVWLKDKLFLKKRLTEELAALDETSSATPNLLFSEHHLSHAASAFFPSPFDEAAILTIDGVGEWATASICHGKGNSISTHKELRFPHSLGLLYSAATYYLGFKVNSGEYKVMGLAPYGDPHSARLARYIDLIRTNLLDIKADGSFRLNMDYFDFAAGLQMTNDARWAALFGFPRRHPEKELLAEHWDLAMAIQRVTEEVVLLMAAEARRLTGSTRLCMAGGVALNCVANSRLRCAGIFDDIWIQPAAGDAGGALGAALAAHYIGNQQKRTVDGSNDLMQGAYLGPDYSTAEIIRGVCKYGAVFRRCDTFAQVCESTADFLAGGAVVGWFQSRMEWGPRALGNRSILADARRPDMQRTLNMKIKYREGFRPFAPAVLAEVAGEYFEASQASPYMLFVADVKADRRSKAADAHGSLREKLYQPRSDIPAVTHVDYSARLQTVHRETNPQFWQLLESFRVKTGYGLVANTSFNVRGEPIVMTPEDAYRCFMRTEMDYLVMGDCIFDKKAQPLWNEQQEWQNDYTLD